MSFSHQTNESELSPWQKELMSQIIFASKSYYSDSQHFEQSKNQLINSLTGAFKKINMTLMDNGKSINNEPTTNEEYQVFLKEINPILEKFDSHMHLDYRPEFIAEVQQNNQIGMMKNNLSPKFNLSKDPPDKTLLEWKQAQDDPRNNYGFVPNPNICSLHVRNDEVIGKEFYQTPTYILAKEGLFFIEHSNQKVSAEHLVISNKDNEKFLKLCEALPNNKTEYGILLGSKEQSAITEITGHEFPKKNIPENMGYLKVNYLIEPGCGENKSGEYKIGPQAVETLNKIMEKFKDKDEIILDLRNAPQGGSPAMANYLISFFIAQKGLLIDEILDKRSSETEKFYVKNTPVDLSDKRVAILVDETTFSAREAIRGAAPILVKKG
jgi:hypothetical protein